MTSHLVGQTAFIPADLRQPHEILADPTLAATLDLALPVALILVGIIHHLRDADDPYGIVATLLDALPSGSYLMLNHPTADFNAEDMAGNAAAIERGGIPFVPRSRAEVERLFAGLDLVEPGLVPMLAWRPDGELFDDPYSVYAWAGVGRKV
jgi:S-adenosyl methyltransferase